MKKHPLKFVLFLFLTLPLFATELPRPSGWVNDFAGVIDSNSKNQLNQILTKLENQTGIEIAVVTIPTLEGSDIETYTVELYQKWGIGKKGKENGILILAVLQDRNARIEVGYGLEGLIPDAYAGRVLREVIFPYFREKRYGEGLIQGTLTLLRPIEKEYHFKIEANVGAPTTRQGKSIPIPWPFRLLFFALLIYLFIRHPRLLFLLMLTSGGRSRGMRGGFGGGFGGFGGGLSGGGGASGRW